jgi:hypothetical protein
VAGLAGIAGAISYSHMRLLAAAHGDAGWHAHAFPLSVDGIEVVASLVLLADRRRGRPSGWLPRAALATGTAASLAANVATAGTGTISRVIAGWPAIALLIAVKLLSGILEHRPGPVPVPARPSAGPHQNSPADLARPLVPVPSAAGALGPRAPRRTSPPARPASTGTDGNVPAAPRPQAAPGAGIAALLPAARVVRDGLHRDGCPLTRDALAAGLRAGGHTVRNERLTPLLAALRGEQSSQPPGRQPSSAA